MTVAELKKIVGFVNSERDEDQRVVEGICVSSRDVKRGDVFFALSGQTHDGAEFIGDALSRGACCAVAKWCPGGVDGERVILVDDPFSALVTVSDAYYGSPSASIKVVGVTGTNGKTTVTYLLESICREAGGNPGVIGTIQHRVGEKTFNSSLTTPFPHEIQRILASMRSEGCTHVFMEVSSHALSQGRIGGICFDGAIFTNLSRDHLDFHGDMERYYQAKKVLFTEIMGFGSEGRMAVVNVDSPFGERLAGELGENVFTYGFRKGASLTVEECTFSLDGIEGVIATPRGEVKIKSTLIGEHNLSNILASVACSLSLGFPLDVIREGILRVTSVPGRLERVEKGGKGFIFVDYAHTPDGLEQVLSTLRSLGRGRVIIVFGCGGDRDRGKRPLMGEVAGRLADISIVTSDNPRGEAPMGIISDILPGCKRGGARFSGEKRREGNERITLVEPDREAAIMRGIDFLNDENDILLVAGKGHETYQIIGDSIRKFDDREIIRHSVG